MNRIRLLFAKRGFACFVRHVELPQLFGRVARRAVLRVEYTLGMSPKPRIVMGPALPVGVPSLCEAAEIWFETPVEPEEAVTRLNARVPPGFRFLRAARVPEDSTPLSKCCDAARYWLCPRGANRLDEARAALVSALPPSVLPLCERFPDGLELVMLDPSRNGPGALVKALAERGVISGWPDVCVARLCLGRAGADADVIAPPL